MNGKKKQIIAAAIQCFANKGYHAASIQEIADTAGIAKGSLYFYFKSKEELLHSIFRYHYEGFSRELALLQQDRSLSPRESLGGQITLQLERIVQNRDFFTMMLKDQSFHVSEELNKLFYKMRAYTFYSHYRSIVGIYGEVIKPYAYDLTAILSGMLKEYMAYMVIDRKPIIIEDLKRFLLNRLDHLAEGLLQSHEAPLLNESLLKDHLATGKAEAASIGQMTALRLAEIKSAVEELDLPAVKKQAAIDSLQLLEEEFRQSEPRQILIDGMMDYLKRMNIPQLKGLLAEIAEDLR